MADFMTNLTSPAKLALAGYVILIYLKAITPSWYVTALVFVAFLALQIWHDDYLRMRLNDWAIQKDETERKALGLGPRTPQR